MKTIEELGQIALDAWAGYNGPLTVPAAEYERLAFIEVAKAVITALSEDAVSWAVGDD